MECRRMHVRSYTGDTVTIGGTAAGTLALKDVGAEAVTITGNTISGAQSGNYTLTQQTGLTQSVTAKALTVSGITAGSTIYDGTTTAKLGGTAALLAAEAGGAGTTSDGKPYTGGKIGKESRRERAWGSVEAVALQKKQY